MKKVIFIAIATVLLGMSANAQSGRDCEKVMEPFFAVRGHNPADYPADKIEYWCTFSENAFYFVDRLPHNVFVFDFSVLTNMVTGQKAAADTPVDLNTFSYFSYDFINFQVKDYHRTIYFELHGNQPHKYLALRCHDEIMDRTNNPEKYKD